MKQAEQKDQQQKHRRHDQQCEQSSSSSTGARRHEQQCEAVADDDALQQLKKRRASLKRNNTDDSDVERRMARIFHEIELSVDSVDDSTKFITTSHSSGEAPAPPADCDRSDSGAISRVEVETQTTVDDEQVSNRKHLTCRIRTA